MLACGCHAPHRHCQEGLKLWRALKQAADAETQRAARIAYLAHVSRVERSKAEELRHRIGGLSR